MAIVLMNKLLVKSKLLVANIKSDRANVTKNSFWSEGDKIKSFFIANLNEKKKIMQIGINTIVLIGSASPDKPKVRKVIKGKANSDIPIRYVIILV